jgi:hypothetical protein
MFNKKFTETKVDSQRFALVIAFIFGSIFTISVIFVPLMPFYGLTNTVTVATIHFLLGVFCAGYLALIVIFIAKLNTLKKGS